MLYGLNIKSKVLKVHTGNQDRTVPVSQKEMSFYPAYSYMGSVLVEQ